MTDIRVTVTTAAGLLLILVGGALQPLEGQATVNFTERSNVLVGYVVSPPRQMVGFGAVALAERWHGLGLLVDGRFTTDSPGQTILPDRTPAEADAEGDIFNVDKNTWTTLNVAVVKGLTPEIAGYLGAGASWKTAYLRYYDESQERGDFGFYWVEDEAESRIHPNLHGGVLFRMGHRIAVQVGGQSAPLGVVVGGFVRLR